MGIVQCHNPVAGTTGEAIPTSSVFGGLPCVTSPLRTGEQFSWRANAVTTATKYMETGKVTASHAFAHLATNDATYRFYFRAATLPASASEEICQINNSSNAAKMWVRVKSDGKLQAYNSANTQMGSDTTFALSTGVWYRIEIRCGTGTSAAWEVRIYDDNDSPTLLDSISGTGNLTTVQNGKFYFGKVNNRNGQTVDFYYTGVKIRDDTTWCGHSRYKVLLADGQGTYTAWTNTYTGVDEAPPHDNYSTYIRSSTINQVETVTLQSCAAVGLVAGDTIDCVKAIAMCGKEGVANLMSLRWRIAATDYDSGSNTIAMTASSNGNTGFMAMSQVRALNPNTGVAWTQANVDGLEIGVIQGSGGDFIVCTALWCQVDYVPTPPVTAFPRSQVVWA